MVIEPGNNVNSSNSATSKTRQGQVRASENTASNASSKPVTGNSDNVSLSDAGQSLNRLEAAVANVPEVNAERVAEIKAALEKGQYQVDAYTLAGKMLAQDDL